jgi:hypothetical protein
MYSLMKAARDLARYLCKAHRYGLTLHARMIRLDMDDVVSWISMVHGFWTSISSFVPKRRLQRL